MLTPDAKDALRRTIRGLRERLTTDLHAEAESTYGLARADVADLPEVARERRARLLGHLDEHARSVSPAESKKSRAAARDRVLSRFVLEAAHTLVNRLVLLRHMEALSAGRPRAERLVPIDVVTKGWQSPAYRAWREHAPELCDDATEGYATLLALVFGELAHDLPGLYGDVGITRLFPVPPSTLRAVVEALNEPALDAAWTDDTTLGWVYQFWNDPERERLDAKLNEGGKVEQHEIASKTQMFTERYMVEWLLQNSLGLTWLAMCKKHGWRPDAEDVLNALDRRRAEWRARREAGEVALDALMPIESPLEDRWKYWVPQPIPDDAVAKAPESIRDLKLLDPACGSGHFLVIAFDLLAALYEVEGRHRGETWTARQVAEWIVENNLHGVDIDPRAVQIAAAGLYVKWRTLAADARPKQVNLVAPALHLGHLPSDDPALVQLRRSLASEAGVPEDVTTRLVGALADVDHLGSLLKVDRAIDEALRPLGQTPSIEARQGDIFRGMPAAQERLDLTGTRKTVLERIEDFLAQHGAEGDLGLRLDGEELAAGLRFLRIVSEDTYHVVVGNPPYQGTGKMADSAYIQKEYATGKADLYTAFLLRGLDLTRVGGVAGLLTMRGWMFQATYTRLRSELLGKHDLRSVADLGTGAFSSRSMDDVISSVMVVWLRTPTHDGPSVGIQAAPLADPTRDAGKPMRRAAALLAQTQRHEFTPRDFQTIEGEPFVFWWFREFRAEYAAAPKLGRVSPVRFGTSTGDNTRFVRFVWEVDRTRVQVSDKRGADGAWRPFVNGAKGRAWVEPLLEVVRWANDALEVSNCPSAAIRNPSYNFRKAVAFSMIGSNFTARVHRYPSVFGNKGSSVFPEDVAGTVAMMNARKARWTLESLNPGLGCEVGDVIRLAVIPVPDADEVYSTVERAFAEREAARETSVEFRRPGPSPWTYARDWAQRAVDRRADSPLPPYEPAYDRPSPIDFISYAFGVAVGRFGAKGEGILDAAPSSTLPHGILFLSSNGVDDSLWHPACEPLHAAWAEHGAAIGGREDLRGWLRTKFFAEHKSKARYDSRPIYFPLSSKQKSFVAWVSIHRWQHDTLQVLLSDHLRREEARLDGLLSDLRRARTEGAKRAEAERRFRDTQRLSDELAEFVALVRAIAEEGPPPTDDRCLRREKDARFAMDLDDGVMVNSAALWPLLEPQWKDPKKWWKELATAEGRKDYDWSHQAARYFPARVEKKCHDDPSLAVAHKCFWRLHPAKAYAWELRLQDEIRPDFTIDESGSDEERAAFLKQKPQEAAAIVEAEQRRRQRKKDATEVAAQTELGEGETEGGDDIEETS